MTNSSTTKDDFLELVVYFEQQLSYNREYEVRLVWRVKNISKKRIRIRSYYVPFYTGNKKRGVFTQGRWIRNRFKISNDHIITYLYPTEERSFVWEWVKPSYYGLTGNYSWHYRLELHYTVDGDPLDRKVECRSRSMRIGKEGYAELEKLGPFTSPEIIKPLVNEFPTITDDFDERMEIQRVLVPYGRAAIIPDAVLLTDSELVVVQLATYVSRKDLQRVDDAISSIQQWAEKLDVKPIGVIVVVNDDDYIRKIAEDEYPRIRIIRMQMTKVSNNSETLD